MRKTTIVETVPCAFGDNGYHDVTIVLNENQMLDDIKCGCDEAREETEGLILLGTDEMKTCLGFRNKAIWQIKEGVTSSNGLPKEYRDTMLFVACAKVATRVQVLRRQRELEADEEKKRKAIEQENDHVTTKLNAIIRETIGDDPARVIQVTKREVGGKKTYCLGTRGGRSWSQNIGPFRTIATRKEGYWVFPDNFEARTQWQETAHSYGGYCEVCKGDGYSEHNHTKNHIKNAVKAIMLAAQATSGDGLKIVLKNDEKHEFKYRKNARNLVGIKFIPGVEWDQGTNNDQS